MKHIARYVLAFLVVFAAAALGAFFASSQALSWYSQLIKPDFTPSGSLFAPIWFFLYFFMALALARVWNLPDSSERKRWIFTFFIQLCANILWSVLFFSFHGLLLSVICVIILWFAVVVLTLGSYELDRPSFWLLAPYLAFVTFAFILNVALWWIN